MVLQSKYIDDIAIHGYCHIHKGGEVILQEILNDLGEVIQRKDIVIEANPKKWATSTKEMPLHTDHSKVDFVVWHCVEQTDDGGESLLSDVSLAFNQLTPTQKELLLKVELKNVLLFEGDLPLHPVVCIEGHSTHFYFVPWLAKENESEEVKNALKELETKSKENVTTLRLEKDDILVVDNKRILHGRNPITGSTNRLLKRHWIKANKR